LAQRIFNQKFDCWRQTHVTTFGEGGTLHCAERSCQSHLWKYWSANFIKLPFVVVSHKIFLVRLLCIPSSVAPGATIPFCPLNGMGTSLPHSKL